MFKWLLVIVVIVVASAVIGSRPGGRWRLGRLPGDLSFTCRGRLYHLPFVSTILLSLLAWLLFRAL